MSAPVRSLNYEQTKEMAVAACGPDAAPTAHIRFHMNSGVYQQMWRGSSGTLWIEIPVFGFGDSGAQPT